MQRVYSTLTTYSKVIPQGIVLFKGYRSKTGVDFLFQCTARYTNKNGEEVSELIQVYGPNNTVYIEPKIGTTLYLSNIYADTPYPGNWTWAIWAGNRWNYHEDNSRYFEREIKEGDPASDWLYLQFYPLVDF